MSSVALVMPALLCWVGLLMLPWRPWSTREHLEAEPDDGSTELHGITVLIPARNEGSCLASTLQALHRQGRGLKIVVVDDQSADDTAALARECGGSHLRLVRGTSPPDGWTGKLWALEQGLREVTTPLVLLLDADVVLQPGMIAAMLAGMRRGRLDLVSVMVDLHWQRVSERLLLPAFVYFFKLLYPFALANRRRCRRVAAAAGGCILVKREVLQRIGAFRSIRGQLIDDCALARAVKREGADIWVGLTRSARNQREYGGLRGMSRLIARCAFAQLHHSALLLTGLTLLFALLFWVPLVELAFAPGTVRLLSLAALAAMVLSYLPTLRYYRMSPVWCLTMPVTAAFYLASTWYSAKRHWRGLGSEWKGRNYRASQPGTSGERPQHG